MMPARTENPGVSLQALLAGMAQPAFDCLVNSLSLDSRLVEPGGLFLAVAGQARHGLIHVDQALQAGAVAVVYDPATGGQDLADQHPDNSRFVAVESLAEKASVIADRLYASPSNSLAVIGITGTNGKTSCSHFLGQVMDFPQAAGVIGTLGWGLSGSLVSTINTTPDPVSVQAHLADLLDRGAKSVAMEVSSHGLDQGRVSGVQFRGAVFTNLGRDHLDYHGDLDAYAAAKQQLFARPELEFAVINLNDPAADSMLQALAPSVRRIGYSSADASRSDGALEADVLYAQNIGSSLDGLRFDLVWNDAQCQVHTRLLGRFNVDNVLAVMGVLLAQGLALDTVAARIADLRSIPGRMETFGVAGQTPLVIVDYAHTADALDTVLSSLRAHAPAQLITVFGCGGDRDAGKRPLMGAAAESHSDRVIVTDDNPRHESPSQITDQILTGMQSPDHAEVIHDRKKAIETALKGAEAGDIVLIAGKGHETTQQIGDQLYQFSDRQRVREALLKWRGAAQGESGWTQ